MTNTVKFIETFIDNNQELFKQVARDVWSYAEVGYTEVKSSARLEQVLEDFGFRVQKGVGEAPTAFVAEYGSGRPIIGLMAEYDALPNLSQKLSDEPDPVVPGGNGHGCGHNLLGTGALAGAITIKEAIEAGLVHGTVRLYGTPAEELLTGKVYMAKMGVFNDLDIALGWHPEGVNAVMEFSTSAQCSAKFHFHGHAAHAASDPFNGRSALDAVELMNVSSNYLREHVVPGVKLHYATIVPPDLVPNTVPAEASVWYFVRAEDTKTVKEVFDRLVHCANGAAEMTGTTVDQEFLGGCSDYLPNRFLNKILHEEMEKFPVPTFTAEEHEYARKVGLCTAESGERFRVSLENAYEGVDAHTGNVCQFLAPLSDVKARLTIPGSLDIGDVSRIVPTTQFTAVCQGYSCGSHSWQCTSFSASNIGMQGMLYAAKVFASMGTRLMQEPHLIEEAHKEFHQKTRGQAYVSPLPDSWKPGI